MMAEPVPIPAHDNIIAKIDRIHAWRQGRFEQTGHPVVAQVTPINSGCNKMCNLTSQTLGHFSRTATTRLDPVSRARNPCLSAEA